jgi:hypothetical protein
MHHNNFMALMTKIFRLYFPGCTETSVGLIMRSDLNSLQMYP